MSGVTPLIRASALALVLLLLLFTQHPTLTAHAGGAFTVNTTADAVDTNPGDGVCETATPGQCSLRAAVQEANAFAGSDSITISVAGTHILSLTSDSDAGTDLDITEAVTINGSGPTTIIDAGATDRGIDVSATGFVSISNLAVINGSAASGGTNGGGIRNSGAQSQLQLSNVTLDGNDAPNADIGGGAVYNTLGTLTIANSTLSGNNTGAGGGGGAANTLGALSLTNVTVSGNNAPIGGAVYNTGVLGTVSTNNVTVADNSSDSGGAVHNAGGNITFRNSIIAGSTPDNCSTEVGSLIISTGHNVSSDASCSFAAGGDLNSTEPELEPLADNGGPTQTNSLLGGTPAVDAGDDSGCAGTDQRGVNRPQGAHCDIGSFELVIPLIQGDVDCESGVNSIDALKILRHNAGLSVSQTQPCVVIGTPIAGFPFGDVDCSSGINSIDALKILRANASLNVVQIEPCTDIGQPFQ